MRTSRPPVWLDSGVQGGRPVITWGFLGETVLQMGAAHPIGPFALERMWYVVPGQ